MPETDEPANSRNPFFTINPAAHGDAPAVHVLDTLRTAISMAVRTALFTIRQEPAFTQSYLSYWITKVGVVLGESDAQTRARALAWEIAFSVHQEHEDGLRILDFDSTPVNDRGEVCTCPRDHELDVAVVNEFVTCAQRGDFPAALLTLRALERLGAEDLEMRNAELLGGLAHVLARLAGALAGLGSERVTD